MISTSMSLSECQSPRALEPNSVTCYCFAVPLLDCVPELVEAPSLFRVPSAPDLSHCSRHRAGSRHFFFRCTGHRPPSSGEFYAAVRADSPDERQRAILDAWSSEAEDLEVLDAWAEHAYTFRQLALALQCSGITRCAIAEALNRLSM